MPHHTHHDKEHDIIYNDTGSSTETTLVVLAIIVAALVLKK